LDTDAVVRTVRRIGYGLLVAAIVIDIASIPFASVRGFVRTQRARAFDEVLPRENLVVDLALGVLASSDAIGSALREAID
jgi:hypothetical protein